VSSVAHEINQPLAAILSNAQAAQRFLGRSEPDLEEVEQALGDIVTQDRRASEVITHLRSMVRRELRDPVALDLGTLLADLDPLLHKDATERGIELTVDVEAELPPVEGDPIQLQQVLLNLVLNALDAVEQADREDGAVRIAAAGESGGSVEVVVSDNGVGLGEGDEERVFEAFVTSKVDGLGIGLSISRTVVETHGGRISAARNDEGGATFRVELPAAD
jgi:two-component system sensor kinase FixL